MLSLFKRKPKLGGACVEPRDARNLSGALKQQNIKVSDDCCAIFAALAKRKA